MSDFGKKMYEMQRKDPKHWTTRTCVICGEKFQKFFTGWERDIENDVDYCDDCRATGRGHRE